MKESLNWTKVNVLSKAEEDQRLGEKISYPSVPLGDADWGNESMDDNSMLDKDESSREIECVNREKRCAVGRIIHHIERDSTR